MKLGTAFIYLESGKPNSRNLVIRRKHPLATLNYGLSTGLARFLRRRSKLQRLFSAFPGGWPGVGLVMLRVAVGTSLILESTSYMAQTGDVGLSVLALLGFASGILLVLGFLTPLVSVAPALWSLRATWLSLEGGTIPELSLRLLPGVVALAILCLGPGTFSIDGRLFGRRQIVIPQSPGSH